LIQSLPEFIEQLDAATVTLLDRPFVLFGYSLGAMIAFEWARSLRRKGQPQPACLIAAASSAPHQMRKGRALSQLPANELTQALERRYAPMDPKVKQDPEMLDMILRVMRSDLQIMESYNYAPEEPLSCPVLAIGGTRDTIVASDALDAWREQSSAATRVERLEGDHFFLRTQGAALRAIVRSAIQPFALQRRCGGQG
jgi:surfactin synthase thioesterase subunit